MPTRCSVLDVYKKETIYTMEDMDNFYTRNHPNIQSLLLAYIQTCSKRDEMIEYRSIPDTLVDYTLTDGRTSDKRTC